MTTESKTKTDFTLPTASKWSAPRALAELSGLSVFFRDADRILHSYSTYFRGLDTLLPMYHLPDRTPLGRQETKENSMAAGEASWIRYREQASEGVTLWRK